MTPNTPVKKIFGTDGVRDIAGEGWLAPDKVEAMARVIGRALVERPGLLRGHDKPFPNLPQSDRDFSARPTVLIGRDTRPSGPAIQRSLARGLASQGVDVIDVGVEPTPAVALLAALWKCSMAAVISASHNPPHHNGIKFLTQNGFKIPDAVEVELERELLGGETPADVAERGCITQADASHEYAAVVVRNCMEGVRLDGMKVVLDCANGAAGTLAPLVFASLGAHVIALNHKSDGESINDDCGSLHAEKIAPVVLKESADIGISFDGDGDRAIFVDETGVLRDGDHVLALCAARMKSQGRLTGDVVVGTVMANLGLEKALAEIGVELVRTPVGDRYVAEAMIAGGYALGGEQSGHILFGEYSNTGDGIITALNVVRTMRRTGRPLSDLSAPMVKYPQVLLNVPVREKVPFDEIESLREVVREVENELADRTRLVLRYSGTEPLARVMLEGVDQAEIDGLARRMADIIQNYNKSQ